MESMDDPKRPLASIQRAGRDRDPDSSRPPNDLRFADVDTRLMPARKVRKRRGMRIVVYVLLLLILAVGGLLVYGYVYFQNNINQPIQQFVRTVGRSKDEPPVDDSAITGRPWNILLMGSDNDSKYNFPALLTQVMMVVHIDPIKNSVYMVSIPRDSWVYVPENGAKHKIDQAFFLGATQNNSFDNGVRLARLTIEKDYGITIDRYAWVGLSGVASVIDTLGGVDDDVTHPIHDDNSAD